MMIVKMKGMTKTIKGIKSHSLNVGKKVSSNMKKAGLLLQRESQKIVPVDKSNLRGSAFTRSYGIGIKTHVTIGYTANYAAYVHEDLTKAHGEDYNTKYAAEIAASHEKGRDTKGRFTKISRRYHARKPDEQAKFLEKPARINRRKILRIIAGKK